MRESVGYEMLPGQSQQHKTLCHSHPEQAAWTMHSVNILTHRSNEGSVKKQCSSLMPHKVASRQCTYAGTGGTSPYLHHWWSQNSPISPKHQSQWRMRDVQRVTLHSSSGVGRGALLPQGTYTLSRTKDILQQAQGPHNTPPEWSGSQDSHL